MPRLGRLDRLDRPRRPVNSFDPSRMFEPNPFRETAAEAVKEYMHVITIY